MVHHGHPTPFQFCRPQFRPKWKIISQSFIHTKVLLDESYLDFSWGRFIIRIGWTDSIIDFFGGNGSSNTSSFGILWLWPWEIFMQNAIWWGTYFLIGLKSSLESLLLPSSSLELSDNVGGPRDDRRTPKSSGFFLITAMISSRSFLRFLFFLIGTSSSSKHKIGRNVHHVIWST